VKVRELAVAVAELDEALTWYGAIRPALAASLLDEVEAGKKAIAAFPLAWTPLAGGLRRYSLHRFPYALIYSPGPGEILILAYAHQRRRPGYWKDRLRERH